MALIPLFQVSRSDCEPDLISSCPKVKLALIPLLQVQRPDCGSIPLLQFSRSDCGPDLITSCLKVKLALVTLLQVRLWLQFHFFRSKVWSTSGIKVRLWPWLHYVWSLGQTVAMIPLLHVKMLSLILLLQVSRSDCGTNPTCHVTCW